MNSTRRTNLLLLAGLVVGAVLATAGLLRDAETSIPAALDQGAIATVNGRRVPRTRFEQAIALIERERGRPVTTQERQRALDRIIDEELLVQKAQALGITESDRKLRADIVASVLDSVAGQSRTVQPSERELRRFFEDNRTVLAGPGQLRIEAIFFASARPDARERAFAAAARLRAGEAADVVRRELGDAPAVEVPSVALPATRLAEYVGPTAATIVPNLTVGDVSDPIGGSDGYRVVILREREESQATFESMREQVVAEYRRRAADDEVTRYLDELRRGAEIEVVRDVAEGAKVGLDVRQ
ncbi:MAG TPA: peptidylprolyl isomerase [Candidatus Binatia bacterium]|nr:peptidylprolyl isomerase [Candidatus Binatia bacterium]